MRGRGNRVRGRGYRRGDRVIARGHRGGNRVTTLGCRTTVVRMLPIRALEISEAPMRTIKRGLMFDT